jgi:hypothetical protein
MRQTLEHVLSYASVCSSMDASSEGGVYPSEAPVLPEREVTASKAVLYTNVYSGPSHNREVSEFSLKLIEVKNVAEVATKDIGELRGDLEKVKEQLKELPGDKLTAPPGPRTLGGGFDDDGLSSARDAQLKEIRCAPDL